MSKQKRINSLSSISGLTAQMRAVYRIARTNIADNDIDPPMAKLLVDILKNIVAAHRDSELETRVQELEQGHAKK